MTRNKNTGHNEVTIIKLRHAYRVIDPNAGKHPGMNDAAKFAAPSATSSRFGLIMYPNRDAFCLAETMESRKPTTETRLYVDEKVIGKQRMDGVEEIYGVGRRTSRLRSLTLGNAS